MRSLLTGFAAALAGLLALPAAAQPYAYVPNFNNNNVSVVDTATNVVTTTIVLPGASQPYAVAANTAGSRVYIGNYGNNTVSVIDTASNTAAAAVAVPVTCFQGLAINPAGTRGYAVGCNSNNVAVLDLTTAPISVLANLGGFSNPQAIVVSPDGSRVYVANHGAQNVAVINTATNAVSVIATSSRNPYTIAIDATGSNLWVGHVGTPHGVTRISDPAGTPVVGTGIDTGGAQPVGIVLNASGSTAYVTHYGSSSVSAIITATGTVSGTAATGSQPTGVSITPDGSRVLVANASSDTVSVFNAGLVLQTTVSVGSGPFARGIFIAPAAAPVTADISGTITNSLGGGAMSGVTVARGAPTTTTNGSGVYTFSGLANGSYTITPSVYNYVFSPTFRTVNLAGVNATGQNFTGTYNGIPDITDLRALVVAANLTDTRVRNSLLAPLDAALVWLNGSNPNKVAYSCSNLAKFIAATRQNISFGKLPAATGNPWIVAANDILALSGCPTR